MGFVVSQHGQLGAIPHRLGSGQERDQDGTRTGRDGPHLGTWMGPKCCKTEHMANLDGTPSVPGWDLDRPRIDPGEGLDGTPGESNRLLGLSESSPFLSVFPLQSMRSGGAIPPLKRGISAILVRYPMKTRQMGAIPPSAILSRKGIAR